MPLFPTLAGFFRRHKRKILFTTAASVSAYWLFYQFVIKRFRSFQDALKQELFVKEQIKRRFIQTQTDCYLTVLALLPVLTLPIKDNFPSEAITNALKLKKTPARDMSSLLTTENLMAHSDETPQDENLELLGYLAKSKLDLWLDLKNTAIARILTLIYSVSGMLLLTRLQLNILARKSYLELAIVMAGGSAPAASHDSFDYFVEQNYLSLSWWLLNHGWMRLAARIEPLVQAKFAELGPKTELTVETFRLILYEIVADTTDDRAPPLAHAIFPSEYENLCETIMNTSPELLSELENKDLNLVKLINETNFIFANQFTSQVYTALLQTGLDTLCDGIATALDAEKPHRLASFLAQLSVQLKVLCDTQTAGDDDMAGNPYTLRLSELPELDEFSASIYSNFE